MSSILLPIIIGVPLLIVSITLGFISDSRYKSRSNTWIIIIIITLLLLSAMYSAMYILFNQTPHPPSVNAAQASASDYTWLYIIAIMLIYVIGITVSLMVYRKGKRQYQQQIEDLDRSSEQLLQGLSRGVGVDNYGRIQILLNQMKGYYIFAIRQAIVSSIVSVACIIIGVVIMAIFVITAFFFKSNNISLSYLTGILAAITELIGGLAFTFNSQASKKMDRYFEGLKELQNRILAVDLLDRYSDEDKRQQALDRIMGSLIDDKSKNKEDTKQQ